VESLHWSRLLAGDVAREEEPMQEQVFWWELQPVESLCWSSLFLKDCTVWKAAMLEQFMKDCIP